MRFVEILALIDCWCVDIDDSWQDMKDVFRKYCDVLFTDVYIDRDGKSRGVAEFRSKDDVRRAIKYVDDTEVRGSRIYVVRRAVLCFVIVICYLDF